MINTIKYPIALGLILTAGTLQTSASPNALSPQALTIELARCRVEILVSSEERPGLQVFHRDGSEVPIETIALSIRENAIRVRDQEDQDSLSDLIFSFTLLHGQNFQVNGTDLDLVITDPEIPADRIEDEGDSDSAEEGAGACQTPRILNLVGGTAHIIGGGSTTIFSTEVELNLERTSQALEIEATGGRFGIRGHRGKITLNAEHFGGVIADHQGDLEMVMTQGQLTVGGGAGAIQCQSNHFMLSVTDHQGPLEANGSDSTFIVQNSRLGSLRLTGAHSSGQFSGGQGHIRAAVEGGGLTVEDWTGRIDLQASRGTTLDIESVDGDFAFSVFGAIGAITAITGHTRGALTESDLEFSRLKSIEITADASETSVVDVPHIAQMNIVGGYLKYESSLVIGRPKIDLSNEATADIVIPQPCIVRCSGAGAKDTGSISVSGCEYRSPNQPWGKRHPQEKKPIHLEIEMREFSEVFVSGY